jgi:hypothetical protein
MVDVAGVKPPEQGARAAIAAGAVRPHSRLATLRGNLAADLLQVQRAVIYGTTTSFRIGNPALDARLSGSGKT